MTTGLRTLRAALSFSGTHSPANVMRIAACMTH